MEARGPFSSVEQVTGSGASIGQQAAANRVRRSVGKLTCLPILFFDAVRWPMEPGTLATPMCLERARA